MQQFIKRILIYPCLPCYLNFRHILNVFRSYYLRIRLILTHAHTNLVRIEELICFGNKLKVLN